MNVEAQAPNLGLGNLSLLWRLSARGLLILAFLVAGGAFSLQLSGLDPHAPVGADSASTRSQVAIGLAFATLLLSGARDWRRGLRLLRANAILLALPALAILSTLWAPEPAVAIRRALAFAATTLCGFAIAAQLPGLKTFRFLAQAAALGVALSLVYLIACPAYGVHQITDGVQSIHAGDWRGVFVHRTALGQLSALSFALTVYAGPGPFGFRIIWAGVLAIDLLCLYGAHSGGGWVSAAVLLAAPWLLAMGRWLLLRGRWIGLAVAVGGLVLALLLAPWMAALSLDLLHKDPTLTGRTALWRLMLKAVVERPVFGFGYSTGFRNSVAKLVAARSRFGYVPNAQNGYLDVLLNLGLVGLGLVLASMAVAVWRALRLAMDQGWRDGLRWAPLLIFVFIGELNLIEAATISANDIFVLIYVAAFVASGDVLSTRGAGRRSTTQAMATKTR